MEFFIVFFFIGVLIAVIYKLKAENDKKQRNVLHENIKKTENTYYKPPNPYDIVDVVRFNIRDKQSAQIAAQGSLKIASDCKELVNNTKNPDVFFTRYDLLIKQIKILIDCSQYVSFTGDQPQDMLNHVLSIRQSATENFIIRYWKATCEKAETLKTDAGKQNQYKKFYENCMRYKQHMNSENIKFCTDLYDSMSNEPLSSDKSSGELNSQDEKDRADYDWLSEHLPEIAPKSFSGYRRMKNAQSANYLKLVESAKENGRVIN